VGSAVGNDVVDLTRAEARGKARDQRFVRRVFTAAEAAFIQSASDPDRALWMFWAAKEAAFKVVSKQERGALFAHRNYEVQPPSQWTLDGTTGRARGAVTLQGEWLRELAVDWEWSAHRVHCLAVSGRASFGSVRSAVGRVDPAAKSIAGDATVAGAGGAGSTAWTQRETLSARTPESCEARLLAKRLAYEAGLGEVEVVRNPGDRRMGPPLLYAVGSSAPLAGWDLTLSHDGAFAAAALCPV
jgi:phosphopantetheinyl transferase (holo-ACP synthase)